MSELVLSFDRRLNLPALLAVAALAFGANLAATAWLDASHASSGFPVPYHVAQLSFDAEKIRGWYTTLSAMGRLDDYVRTQVVDFAFIYTVAVLHPSVLLLIGRLFPDGSAARRRVATAAAWSLAAPVADAAENLVSFVMLAQPTSFPSALALVYSSLAAVKFAMFTFAYLAAAVAIAAALVMAGGRFLRSRRSTTVL